MKMIHIETKLDGHHLSYLRALEQMNYDSAIILPGETSAIDCKSKYIIIPDRSKKLWYFPWIKKVNKVINTVNPDIVHFVYGDDLYRFFGIRLPKSKKIVITCHQVRRSLLRDMAYRRISQKVNAVVVHTDKLRKDFESLGIHNVYHIEYPQFISSPYIADARKKLGIQTDAPVILALGATRQDKGLDILLDALNNVNLPFFLLIAGEEKSFSQKYIDEHVTYYRDKVKTILRFLSEMELSLCLNAADIICLPYRKSFDGASGPLGEGVALGKMIIGSDHGSLGQLIQTHHLGATFKCEDTNDLSSVLQNALTSEWISDEAYQAYQDSLNPIRFQRDYLKLYKGLLKEGNSK